MIRSNLIRCCVFAQIIRYETVMVYNIEKNILHKYIIREMVIFQKRIRTIESES